MAFPNTPIIDDFNRANAQLSAPWVVDPRNDGDMVLPFIQGNQLICGFPWSGAYWSAATFGPDVEVYMDIPFWDGTGNSKGINLLFGLQEPATANWDGYGVAWIADSTQPTTDILVPYRADNGVYSYFGFPSISEMQSGDSVGVSFIGGVITAYRKRAGVWTIQGTWTDNSPITAPGYLGFRLDLTTSLYDNFGGGRIGVTIPQTLTANVSPSASLGRGKVFGKVLSANVASSADLQTQTTIAPFHPPILRRFKSEASAKSNLDRGGARVLEDFDVDVSSSVSGFVGPGNLDGLPRVPWEGGSEYWAQFPKTLAAGWTDPAFFPISVFLGKPELHHPQVLSENGINVYMATEGQSPGALQRVENAAAYGLWLMVNHDSPYYHDFSDPDWPQMEGPGFDYSEIGEHPNVVGWFLADEPDMGYGGWPGDGPDTSGEAGVLEVVEGMAALAGAHNDGRFLWCNFGNGVLRTFWSPNVLDEMVDAIDGFSVDKYTYTSPQVRFEFGRSGDWQAACGTTDPTEAANLAKSSASYGWMVKQMRERFQDPTNLKPHWGFVESKMPFLAGDAGKSIITHGQMEGAIWSAIINEARGIAYFQHNGFDDPDAPAIDPNTGQAPTWETYSIVDGPQTYKDAVRDINERVTALAPIINTQSYAWDFTQYGAARMDTMLKAKDGFAYIFAMIGPGGTTGNKTFTLPNQIRGTQIEVLNESRTINVTTGQFSDTFANEYDCHIYKISINGDGDPFIPPPPFTPSLPDDFNVGSAPLGSAWTADIRGVGELSPPIIANAVRNNGIATMSAWWNVDVFGPNVEVYLTLSNWVGDANLKGAGVWARVSDPGTALVDGYLASFAANTVDPVNDAVGIVRYNNGVYNLLAVTSVPNHQTGDIFAFRLVGDVLTLRRNRGGVWSDVLQHTDVSPLPMVAGYVGLEVGDAPGSYDDFNAVNL